MSEHENTEGGGRSDWQLYLLALATEVARTIFVYGGPGIGKTHTAYHHGRVQDGFYAVTITDETTAAELRGHFIFKGGDALWHDGPFIRAMREGKRLVVNEIVNASADVLALMMPLFESFETAELTLPSGETIRPSPGFHIVATANEPPDRLPEPLRDRFVCTIRLKEPHPDALAGLEDWLREAAQDIAAIDDERGISARGWQNLQALLPTFGLLDACRLAFGPDRGPLLHDALQLRLATRNAC